MAGAIAYGLYIALRTYEVDLGVYLRLGGRYIFTSHLYSFVLPNTSLPFTYPPFAALLFAPWQRTFTTVGSVQTVWTMCNLAALLGVLVLSVRLVRPTLDRVSTWRLALALSLPALLLNPVLITIGFGQVNLVVTFLVMWDLLSERRIGKRQVPLGIATGLAAAVKLTPLLFVPYLLLTRRWRGALNCVLTFVACELVTFLVSPTSSIAYWTKAIFKPGRAGDLSIVDNQNLWAVLDRFTHVVLPGAVMLPVLIAAAAGGLWLAALAHRRSSPLLGVLICAATCLAVSPISWVHHMVWVVPAILWLALAPDRPRWGRVLAAGGGRPLLECACLVGPVQEHVGSAPRCRAADRGELVLLRHGDLRARCGGARPPAESHAPSRRSFGCRRCRSDPAPQRTSVGWGNASGSRDPDAELSEGLCGLGSNGPTWHRRHRQNDPPGRGDRGGSGGIRHPAPLRIRPAATVGHRSTRLVGTSTTQNVRRPADFRRPTP